VPDHVLVGEAVVGRVRLDDVEAVGVVPQPLLGALDARWIEELRQRLVGPGAGADANGCGRHEAMVRAGRVRPLQRRLLGDDGSNGYEVSAARLPGRVNEFSSERNVEMSAWAWVIVGVGAAFGLSVLVALGLAAILGRMGQELSEALEPDSWTTAPLAREVLEAERATSSGALRSGRRSLRTSRASGHYR
jgi:hypothetical protein